ncbi:hypothetical protein [Cellulophaga sp. Z1A5H]|uniref:hypothetical protein n=1 Tax=Cellulophaga sp. Z1A5H TaxID=2687291 RepID=UPI0013FDF243|nr:hypothetical protein [Cellulophaga sp. Z1A5H]
MPKLIVERTSEWNNKARQIDFYIDGVQKGILDNGKTLTFDLEPGTHEIVAKINNRRSEKIQINFTKDETKTFKLAGFKYGSLVMPLIIGSVLIFLVCKAFLNIELKFLLALSLLAFLYPVYYMTLGKNNYLSLSDVTS